MDGGRGWLSACLGHVGNRQDHGMSGKKTEVNSYRSILKGVSVFGGVKVFEVLTGIVRGKFVAMFLGPQGMGISSLFMSAFTPIQQFASLGLNLAIVKEVAASGEDEAKRHATFAVARRLTLLTALFGALICFFAAPWLSRASFGSADYTWQFMLLAVAVFFGIGGNGRLAMLQGLHEVKRLSRASLTGGLAGLFVGVPLYYFFGDKGIVPSIIVMTLSSYLFFTYNLRKAEGNPARVRFAWQEHSPMVKRLIATGLILMAGDLIGSVCTYGNNVFVRVFSGETTLGLFQAANSLTNQYSGMVFTAMSLDYFPRLIAVARDNEGMRGVVNRQTEIVGLLIAPAAIALILTAPLVIRLLLTDKFLPAVELMRWLGLGVTLKALMFPMGYITFAKDDRRLFFWMEGVFCNLLTLVASCGMFLLFGLNGLGYGLVLDCFICFWVYYFVNRRKYGYDLDAGAWRSCLYAVAGVTGALMASFIPSAVWSYAIMGVIFAAVCAVSFRGLRQRIRRR